MRLAGEFSYSGKLWLNSQSELNFRIFSDHLSRNQGLLGKIIRNPGPYRLYAVMPDFLLCMLRFALAETGSQASSVMVGDREHDVLGALRNNMRTVGVTYGYGSLEELNKAGVHHIADRPQDLLPLLL